MANAPIEAKVRAATGAAGLLGAILTGLNSAGAHSTLLAPLPQWAQSIITLLAPPLAVLLAGWIAPHTPRPAAPAAPAAPVASEPAPAPVAPTTAAPAVVPDPAPPAPAPAAPAVAAPVAQAPVTPPAPVAPATAFTPDGTNPTPGAAM
ncbi:hypothetical protein [Kitasatospora sp. NBC_01266]|uniref:hypothetical protein n=1 Tax=Kitasatospora sp. NBC_01266 TaxID=2903572 RepID=UPI002E336EDD|nr:hypothetical protein [Kitasatospora sp. NBC_01266]